MTIQLAWLPVPFSWFSSYVSINVALKDDLSSQLHWRLLLMRFMRFSKLRMRYPICEDSKRYFGMLSLIYQCWRKKSVPRVFWYSILHHSKIFEDSCISTYKLFKDSCFSTKYNCFNASYWIMQYIYQYTVQTYSWQFSISNFMLSLLTWFKMIWIGRQKNKRNGNCMYTSTRMMECRKA